MPLPLIPLAILTASALGVGKGAHDLHTANRKRQEASARKRASEVSLARSASETERAQQQMRDDYGRMVLVQMSTNALLDDIVRWLEKGRVSEAEWAKLPAGDRPPLVEWRAQGLRADEMVRDIAKVAAAAGTGQLAKAAVVRFGAASTGAAISGLSGVAARNATLAWLGGGSLAAGGGGMALGATVLSSINVGALAFAAGAAARKVAAQYEASIAGFEAAVRTEVANQASRRRLWAQFRRRFTQVRRANNAVAHAAQRMLSSGDPSDDAQWLAMVHLGKAIAELARYSPIDEMGELNAAWSNPYGVIGALSIEPVDADFVAEELS